MRCCDQLPSYSVVVPPRDSKWSVRLPHRKQGQKWHLWLRSCTNAPSFMGLCLTRSSNDLQAGFEGAFLTAPSAAPSASAHSDPIARRRAEPDTSRQHTKAPSFGGPQVRICDRRPSSQQLPAGPVPSVAWSIISLGCVGGKPVIGRSIRRRHLLRRHPCLHR